MVLRAGVKLGFLTLVAAQSVHSIEEAANRLWEVWNPAAVVSGLFGTDLAVGFAIVNSAIVLFGFWCYAFRVRVSAPSASLFLWFWTLLEAGNGIGHIIMGARAAGYFPGLVTAPLLLLTSLYLGNQLLRGPWVEASN